MFYQEISWQVQTGFPILALLQLLPLALAVGVVVLRKHPLVFPLGVVGAAAEFLLAVELYRRFDQHSATLQFVERLPILGTFHYHAAVDGISVLFTLLTAFLTLIIVFYGRIRRMNPTWRFLTLTFAVECVLMSQFLVVDLLWFTLASGVQIVLVGYLMSAWTTSPEQELALTRFLQFMGIGFLLLLGGVLLLGWNYAQVTGGGWSFDLKALAGTPIQPAYQSVIFFLVFYGLAVRIPLFPLHGWLPLTAGHGTVAVAPVFLLGLKTGIYGLLRFVFPLMPEAVQRWHEFVIGFAVAGTFYAAVLAMMQVNLRRLLAYAVVSHTGVLIIGLFSLGHTAFQGGILLSVNFGLAIAGLLFMTGFVYSRTRTTVLARLGGLFDRLPLIGTAFLIAGLSIIGMPGTPGFDAVHLVLEAAIERVGILVTVSAALSNVAAAGFLLMAFQRAFMAQRPEGEKRDIPPANTLERAIAVTVIGVLLITGFYSEPWMDLIEKSLEGLSTLYQ